MIEFETPMMATDTKTVDVSVWSESKVPAKGSRDTILHRSSLQIQVMSISSGAMGVDLVCLWSHAFVVNFSCALSHGRSTRKEKSWSNKVSQHYENLRNTSGQFFYYLNRHPWTCHYLLLLLVFVWQVMTI